MPINLPTTAQRRDNAFSHPKKISIRPATHDGYQQILHLYTSPLPTFPFLNQDNTLHQTFLNLFKSLCHQKTTQPYPCQPFVIYYPFLSPPPNPYLIFTPVKKAINQVIYYPLTLCSPVKTVKKAINQVIQNSPSLNYSPSLNIVKEFILKYRVSWQMPLIPVHFQ